MLLFLFIVKDAGLYNNDQPERKCRKAGELEYHSDKNTLQFHPVAST
jgi:hypothetical protein